jgi:glutamate-ammonia-ligase adenylyltransferase
MEITPFVYRRWLSTDEIGDMQALKREIERELVRQGGGDVEVKLGRGGLRDIEFAVQFLQLMHGGEEPALRTGNTLAALRALAGHGYLSVREAKTAEIAYVFLREVEHRLQFYADRQTHRLPDDAKTRRRTALALGFRDGVWLAPGLTDLLSDPGTGAKTPQAEDAFEWARREHEERVRAIFRRLFADLFPERDEGGAELSDLLLQPDPDRIALAAAMGRMGFSPTNANAEVLAELGRDRLLPSAPAQVRRFFASAAPRILKALLETGEGEAALRRFARIAGSLGAKAVFFQMLHETPWLLKMTAQLAAWSEYLTEILVANPGLFDELVDALRTGQSKSAAEMDAEVTKLASGGDIADTLRAYRAGELLRIGVRDLLHSVELERTQSELSALAEALLRAQLAQTLRERRAKRGEVRDEAGRPVGFAIVSVGKFGGRELNYGSDLDVLFFYGAEGSAEDGTPAGAYYSEVAQNLSRELERPTGLGRLYAVDARLRPNGSKGPLACSLDAFRRYHEAGSLADWERLALTRARFTAGDEGTGERALHLLRSVTYSPLRSANLAETVREMRSRLAATVPKDDLKRGPGGLVDVEFIVQYLQLIHGPSFPPLRQTSTQAALRALETFGRLTAAEAKTLREGYAFLVLLENRLRIVHGLSADRLPESREALRALARRVGYDGENAAERLAVDVNECRCNVRGLFAQLVR